MTAEVAARVEDGKLDLDCNGPMAEHVTLLAAYADAVAEAAGITPQQVLAQAQSRAVTIRRHGRRAVMSWEVE